MTGLLQSWNSTPIEADCIALSIIYTCCTAGRIEGRFVHSIVTKHSKRGQNEHSWLNRVESRRQRAPTSHAANEAEKRNIFRDHQVPLYVVLLAGKRTAHRVLATTASM